MKRNRILVAAAVLTVLPLASAFAGIDPAKFRPKAVENLNLGPALDLPCEPSGLTRVRITNSFSSPIPEGSRVEYWYRKAVITINGPVQEWTVVKITLGSNVGPGQTLEAAADSKDPHSSECGAWFFAGLADLEVLQISASQGTALLKIRNNNRFVNAPQSVVRIKAMKCSQIQLASVNRTFPTIDPGATQQLSVSVPAPAGCQYYDVHVDPNNAIRESNENNNTYTGVGVCIH